MTQLADFSEKTLSTGPKTPEGKAKSSQNALAHGLTSAKPPLNNNSYSEKLHLYQSRYAQLDPACQPLILELAHLAWKLEQIPQMETEIEQNSELTLSEHFMQDKPTPLTRLWSLHLRLLGRFTSLFNKLETLRRALLQNEPSSVDVPSTEHPSAPSTPKLQNKPLPPSPPSPFPPQLAIGNRQSAIPNPKLAAAVASIPLSIP